MTTYLSQLIESPAYGSLAAIQPEGFCPYLYYTVSPYIYTIANGGWFSWVRKARRPTDRSRPEIKNPAEKKVNRLFVNEVLVRCPHSRNTVIAGVGPWEKGAVAIRILHGEGDCPQSHLPGRITILRKDDAQQSLRYSRLFPEILLGAMTDASSEKAIALFDQGRAAGVRPVNIINPCRYHRRPDPYNTLKLLPDDCCPHVFQHIYPHVLAAMYEADVETALTIQHPGDGGTLKLEIKKEPIRRFGAVKWMMDRFKPVLNRALRPIDWLDFTMSIKTIENRALPGCSMAPGAVYSVNMSSRDFLCPAAFHAVYPYLLLTAAGYRMDWGQDASQTGLIPCPDCAGIVFGIKTIPLPEG